MPFPFTGVCDLLDRLERPHLRDAPYLPSHLKKITQDATFAWFQKHKDSLNEFETCDGTVVSFLRPQGWSDRDYGWNADSLEPLLARFLGLEKCQRVELAKWKTHPHFGDLGARVGQVMRTLDQVRSCTVHLHTFSRQLLLVQVDKLYHSALLALSALPFWSMYM